MSIKSMNAGKRYFEHRIFVMFAITSLFLIGMVGCASAQLVIDDYNNNIYIVSELQKTGFNFYVSGGAEPYLWEIDYDNSDTVFNDASIELFPNEAEVSIDWTSPEGSGGNTYNLTIKVTDANADSVSKTVSFTVTQLVIDTPATPYMICEGGTTNLVFTASGGVPDYTWVIDYDNSDPVFASTDIENGMLYWGPYDGMMGGSFELTLQVFDQNGATASKTVNIAVFTIDSVNGNNIFYEGAEGSSNFNANGGTEPYTWEIDYATSSPILSDAIIDPATGVMTWTPPMGSFIEGLGYSLTIRATDINGASATDTAEISPMVFDLDIDTSGAPDTVYESNETTFTVIAWNGWAPYTWEINYDNSDPIFANAHINPGTAEYMGIVTWTPPEGCGGNTYDLNIQFTDDAGYSVSKTISIAVEGPENQPPVASFIYAPESPKIINEVEFTDTSTDDTGIVSWNWDFGDGETSSEQNPFHIFNGIGDFTVTLTVMDDQGATDSIEKVIHIADAIMPTADFTFIDNAYTGQPVQFTDTSTDIDGEIVSWNWMFDYGQASSGEQNPVYVFENFGINPVSLEVYDNDNQMSQIEKLIDIRQTYDPKASFAFESGNLNTPSVFHDWSQKETWKAVSYVWNFGDGSSVADQTNPEHQYGQAGTYNVTLTLSTGDGYTDTTYRQVTVRESDPESFLISDQSSSDGADMDNGRLVWSENGNIILYDINSKQKSQITSGSGASYPTISGDLIVYQRMQEGRAVAESYNLQTHQESVIFPETLHQTQPRVSGSNIVWDAYTLQGSHLGLYIYNLSTGQKKLVASNSDSQGGFDLEGDLLVYGEISSQDGYNRLYLYNVGTDEKTVISAKEFPASFISYMAVSGNRIVWNEDIPASSYAPDIITHSEIYVYDISTNAVNKICSEPGDRANPKISGNYVIWMDPASGNGDIYLYDISTSTSIPLTTSRDTQAFPLISGNTVIWTEFVPGGGTTSGSIRGLTISSDANLPPVAVFTYIPTITTTADNIFFTDTSSDPDGSIASYSWDFDGIGNSELQNPVFWFNSSGSYNVTLTVMDNNGTASSTSQVIIVVAPIAGEVTLDIPGGVIEGTELTLNTAIAGTSATYAGNEITIQNNGLTTILTLTEPVQPSVDGIITGTIVNIQVQSSPVTDGQHEAYFVADMAALPTDATITSTLTTGTGSSGPAFEAAATNAGLEILDVACTLTIVRVNIEDDDATGIIGANIIMTAPESWVNQNGGPDAVKIIRIPDTGEPEILNTTYSLTGQIYTFTAYSPNGLSVFGLVSVETPNMAPVLGAIGNKTVNEGQLLTFTVSAMDADSDSLTFTATGVPGWATFDVATQKFNGTPDFTQSGNYQVNFTVSDGSATDSEVAIITVNDVPAGTTVILKDSQETGIAGANVSYYQGGWKSFGTTGADGSVAMQLPAGLTQVSFRVSYGGATLDKKQDIRTNPTVIFQTTLVTTSLKDSSAAPVGTGNVTYYAGGWKDFGTLDVSGTVQKELLPGEYSFRMSYAGASTDIKQNVTTNPVVAFQTANVMVELRDGSGGLITADNAGTVKYYSGGWRDFGTTTGGTCTKELLPVNYTFRMTYQGKSNDKAQNISENVLVTFLATTPVVTVRLVDSTGNPITGGTVQYYAGGWKSFGTTGAAGNAVMELLPGNYSFRMTYASGSKDQQQDVGAIPTVVFTTTNTKVELRNSNGVLIIEPNAGTVQYYAGGWKPFGSTNGGSVSKELLAGNYTFRMTYQGTSNDKAQDIGVNPVVVFQSGGNIATVKLVDSTGSGISGGTVQYYAGGWKEFGTTGADGNAVKELLPGNYSFRMSYASGSIDKKQDTSTGPVIFQTKNVEVKLINSTGHPIDTGSVQYYAGGWKSFGTTTNGIANKELLPAQYSFRMSYASGSIDKSQDISSDPSVIFQTGAVVSTSGKCSQYYAGGWKPFTSGMNLLPIKYKFRFTDGTPDTEYTIVVGTVNTIH